MAPRRVSLHILMKEKESGTLKATDWLTGLQSVESRVESIRCHVNRRRGTEDARNHRAERTDL